MAFLTYILVDKGHPSQREQQYSTVVQGLCTRSGFKKY